MTKKIIANKKCTLKRKQAVSSFFIKAQLIYNVVLISACNKVTQLYIYIYTHFIYSFQFIPGDWIQFTVLYTVEPSYISILKVIACICMVCPVVSDSLKPYGLQPTRLLSPRNSPGKNTGVGCYFLLQGLFPDSGSIPCFLCLLHWQTDSSTLASPWKPQVASTNPKLPAHPSPSPK